MLRLPIFEHHNPVSLEAALELLGEFSKRDEAAKIIAGGTDLVPNMKHEIELPQHVVSLKNLGLEGVVQEGNEIVIGAMSSLESLLDEPLIAEHLPALKQAIREIAGPQLRVMGTIGGNVCLNTRCLYINQTYFWRSSLGFCIKKDGDVCHVIKGGKNCVAAASNDSALPFMLYGANLVLRRAGQERVVSVRDFYTKDGVDNRVIEPDEILTQIRVPLPSSGVSCGFEKLRVRKAIDFPLLNAAALIERDDAGNVERAEIVVSALGPRPKLSILKANKLGRPLDEEMIADICKKARSGNKPLTSIATDPNWRREMIPVLIKRILKRF